MSDAVPEYWETGTARTPQPAHPVGWLLVLPAMLVLPFVPKRIGANVSRSGWGVTLFVQAVGLLIGTSMCLFAMLAGKGFSAYTLRSLQAEGLSDTLRLPFAVMVNTAFFLSEGRGDIYWLLGWLVGVAWSVSLVALLLMPFIAAGERSKSLYARSVKLTLWSGVCLIPLGLAFIAVAYVGETHAAQLDEVDYQTAFAGVTALWFIWWLSVLLRLGARYAGPADGPGWRPWRPQCNRCGYLLTGLSRAGRCPECGLAVHDSLPELRHSSPWGSATGISRRPAAFARTLWQVLRGRVFFRSLAVYSSLDAAVRFGLWTVLLTAVLCAIAATAVGASFEGTPLETLTNIALRFAVATGIAVLVFSIGLALVALRACRLGWRDPRPTTAVVCFGSVLFLPTVGALWACALCVLLLHEAGLMRGGLAVPILGWLDYEVLWGLGLSILPIAVFTWGMVRLRRALRDVRFASA